MDKCELILGFESCIDEDYVKQKIVYIDSI